MANVNIKFNNKDYLLSCDDGQEEDLKTLTRFLDKKYSALKDNNPIANLKNVGKIGYVSENGVLQSWSDVPLDTTFNLPSPSASLPNSTPVPLPTL